MKRLIMIFIAPLIILMTWSFIFITDGSVNRSTSSELCQYINRNWSRKIDCSGFDGKVNSAAAYMRKQCKTIRQPLKLSTAVNIIKRHISRNDNWPADAMVFIKYFFNHKGIIYFSFGIITLFILYKLKYFKTWLRFFNTLQHELIHIVVAGIFGGKPVAMEVNDLGGSAYTTKSNFLIRLAPYFLPISCLLILGISFLLNDDYKPVAFVLAGLFYGDFISNTISCIHIQPDIQSSGGKFMAYPLIFVFNIAVFLAIVHMVQRL